jgi:urease accessory protein
MSLVPGFALAHSGGAVPIGGFLSGLVHPVLGYDHLLAMLCVGIVSAQIGGRAIWTVPGTFVTFMAVGGVLGLIDMGLTVTTIEFAIAVSLVLFGLVIAADKRLPVRVTMLGVGFFAIFHGYAHGREMPETAEPVLYGLGFLLGTALIHVTGVVIGDISKHYEHGRSILRVSGGVIALIGLMLIFGVI